MTTRRRWTGRLVALLAVVLAGGAGWWAGRVTLPPPADEGQQLVEPVWAEVVNASVGRTLPYPTTLRQPSRPVADNGLAGVVTQASPGKKDLGDELYRVGNVPVRAVRAPRPMWRDLAREASGDDVRALQELLIKLGHLDGEPSGKYGGGTEAAVKRWQKAEGRAETGTVARGELVAFAKLPVQVTLGEGIVPGKAVAGGEEAVRAPTGEREFVVVVSQEQSRQVPSEATVEVTFEQFVWPAVITESRQNDRGSIDLVLAGPDGGQVCGTDCAALPLDAETTLRSKVIVVPQVKGPAVPAAAVQAAGDGRTYVETEAGSVDVKVLGSGQGLAIVEGVSVGDKVKVGLGKPTDASASPGPSPSATGG